MSSRRVARAGASRARGAPGAGLLALALLAPAAPALGQPRGGGLIEDRFTLEVGWYQLSTDTDVRLDPREGGMGTEVDLEDDLGFEDSDQVRLDFLWRLTPRHHLRGMWFENDRDARTSGMTEIEFGDIVIPVDVEILGRNDTTVALLAYEYAFVHRDSFELAGSIGVNAMEFEIELRARPLTPLPIPVEQVEAAETSAPLPAVGLRGRWRLGRSVYFDLGAQYLEASVEDADGDLQNYRAGLTWMPAPHFGVGVGYEQFRLHVDLDSSSFTGRLDWDFGGPVFAAVASF